MARPIDPEKRPAILKAARHIFLGKGFADTRMSEIADRAGVAVGTLYLYFESKDAIARALAENFYQRVEELISPALDAAIAENVEPEMFRRTAHEAFAIAIQEREFLLLAPNTVPSVEYPPYARTPRGAFLKKLGASLAALMAAGRIRRYEDPAVLAELIVTLSQPVIQTYITLSDHDRERYEAIFSEFLERALAHPTTKDDRPAPRLPQIVAPDRLAV